MWDKGREEVVRAKLIQKNKYWSLQAYAVTLFQHKTSVLWANKTSVLWANNNFAALACTSMW